MTDNINDFLEDEIEKHVFKGMDEIIDLLKKHSIYEYNFSGRNLIFNAIGNIRFKITDNDSEYQIRVAKDESIPFMDENIDSLDKLLRLINRWIMIYKKSYTDPEEHWPDWN